MKNYKDITYKYLKGQKNRTLLTLLGIILSVALITSIGTIIMSARDMLIEETIEDNGAYHGRFTNLDKDTVDKLKNHVEVEEVSVVKEEGFAPIAKTTEDEQENYGNKIPYRYIELEGYGQDAFNMLPIKLKEGRLPKNSNEIIFEEWINEYFDREIKLGDKIKFDLGERHIEEGEEDEFGYTEYLGEDFEKTGEKEYTVVGFISPTYIYRGNFITQGITSSNIGEAKGNNYKAYFSLPNSKIRKAQEIIGKIGKDLGVESKNIESHNELLRLYGVSGNPMLDTSLMALVIFVVVLIVVSTVAVIYNTFNISVLERISQFGLLRSVGATPKQIRRIILREAAILSAIGIPIGLFLGVFAMKIVLYIIGLVLTDTDSLLGFNKMEASISGLVFGISSMVGLLTVFLSAIGPARQASRVSPLEAIRNTGEIKEESFKRVKGSKLIREILGIEGEIARKNLRRNRKRFIITLFSMVISIVLFVVFSTFSDFMFKIDAIGTGEMSDFQVYGQIGDKSEEVYKALREMEDVDRVYKVVETGGMALLDQDQISKKMLDISPDYIFEEKVDGLTKIENIHLSTIGDSNFEKLQGLLESGSIDIDKINEEKGVLVINNTHAYKENGDDRVLMEGYKLKVGDKIPFTPYHHDREDEETEYDELTVVGVLEKGILGNEYNYNGSINMITSEEVFNQVYQGDRSDITLKDQYVNFYIDMTEDGSRETISKYLGEEEDSIPGFHYIDSVEQARENRKISIIMSIFLYGFVAIISLISIINIINTISTNIILRTREIAMIKAVGMTQGGIKKMIAFESLFYGLYATVLGGGLGTGLTYILFRIVAGISEFEYQIPWQNVGIACIGAIIISLLSGVYPLKRINENIIVESMKTED